MTWEVTARRISGVGDGFSPSWFRDPHFPLIRVRPGQIVWAGTLGEKRALITDITPDDVFLMPWPGQYRQDVFHVDDIEAVCEQLAATGNWNCPHGKPK